MEIQEFRTIIRALSKKISAERSSLYNLFYHHATNAQVAASATRLRDWGNRWANEIQFYRSSSPITGVRFGAGAGIVNGDQKWAA